MSPTMTSNTTDTDVQKLVEQLIDESLLVLKKDRDREVVAKRHGLKANQPHTLEQIGSQLGITRERVRQIEKAALTKIRDNYQADEDFRGVILARLDEKGGIIQLQNLTTGLELEPTEQPNLAYLVRIMPDLELIEHGEELSPIVVVSDPYDREVIFGLHESLLAEAQRHGKPVRFDKLTGAIDGPHSPQALRELAEASKKLTNLDGQWGLTSWPEVNPKSIRDKISKLEANPKPVTTQAVHNELIKDSRFVLIGRGIYALAEWGYQAGTVADIIEQILREESPLSREEIIKRVLSRRQVKVATIALNLQEKPQFERVGKGLYALQAGFTPQPRKRRGRPPKTTA